MTLTGGCYCGTIRYKAGGEPGFKIQCHCRECQHLAGGSPNLAMAMPEPDFQFTQGTPSQFTRPDLKHAVTRDFCPTCGTHLLTRAKGAPGMVILKVGTLDDPSVFGGPQAVVYTSEMQAFHTLPEGVPAFEKFPK